jgi:C-methyltransferase C-terminal domain/Putative zinc binding domain/Methyltransferase domain
MPTCRVCGGKNIEQFLDLTDQPHCNSLLLPDQLDREEPYYPMRVWFCHGCTTVQIDHTVPKETMFAEYYYVSGTTSTLREHFADSTARLVKELGLKAGDRVVDIGSNDGTWIKTYAPYGIKATGVEPAGNLAAQANKDGADTLNAFFNVAAAEEILKTRGAPKLVTAAGVFFHLEELHSATEGVAKLIGDAGTFYVQAIYLGEILKHTEFDNIYHEHLTYWTVRSIQKLFDQFDLEVYRVELLPIHGGSLELLVAKKGTRKIDESVGRYLTSETAKGYDKIETYRAFAGRVWKIREKLLAILKDYKARGKTVFAFGAPAKGATTLNSFKITTELVPFSVERNPLKIGKIIPGARIPIIDEITAPVPDAYLILPWNFLPEFLQKKRDYIMAGGAFIVPVPEPVVIDKSNYDQYA